jgi:hypothetical protein
LRDLHRDAAEKTDPVHPPTWGREQVVTRSHVVEEGEEAVAAPEQEKAVAPPDVRLRLPRRRI